MLKLSGEAAVAKAMKECGIDHLFYVTGGMTRMFPVIEKTGMNMVLCRNEKAACNMADGFSRITKKPSVCYAQHGAASAILASMLYEPMYAHSPVVALTGSVSTRSKDQWTYQECYEMPYFESTCKFSADVVDVARLAEYIRIATQIAVSGCPGPTHITMHNDMASAVAEMPEIYGDRKFFRIPPFRTRAEPESIKEAAKLLVNSENPVMVCGSGVHLSEAYNEVRELAELLTIPVATNTFGKGCFPEEHPLCIGVTGDYGSEVTNDLVRKADLVFFVATRAGRQMTEDFTAPEPGSSKIIHLDIEPIVIGRNYKADVALVGDAKSTLHDLLKLLKRVAKRDSSKGKKLGEISQAMKKYENIISPMLNSESIPIKPQRIMREAQKALGPNDIIVSDTGQMICWTTRLLKLKEVGRVFIPCSGTLGSSFALAMGVSFGAQEGQRVLNLIGDGGITYNLSELETALRYNDEHVPFVALVNNNSCFSQTRPHNEDWSKKTTPYMSSSDLGQLDFAKIAQSFGCYGIKVERPGEIVEAIQNAFASGKPAIVDVTSEKREYAPLGVIRRSEEDTIKKFGVVPY
ncbi:MAG: thiamine pyrophosphate-binding protein [Candidatus Bathyarchaeia archaeon]|jgi:acetolactate synthase-1/2/3 large subunit